MFLGMNTLYLMTLSDAIGQTHDQVLKNITKFASPSTLMLVDLETVKNAKGEIRCPIQGFALEVTDNIDATSQQILDSESRRHQVTTPSQLYNTKKCDEECLLPNGENLNMKLKGNADFVVPVDSDLCPIKLRDV
ncbi:unnamed protein product [Albugo candida]|uniref:Uncharacterized protein n=1 Tax=Albugo candida TaxID=65357 RepID=A0A024FT01_9STRA|nr:unnamed protein product [Albugo candida]|eukprot:CCI10091.1 unnamed protein product [Albugo candida]